MKTQYFILTSLIVLAGFASCQPGSENEEPQPQSPPSIVGTWTYRDVTCEVEAADSLIANLAKVAFTMVKLSIDCGSVEFEDNGLYHLYLSASALGEANPLNHTDTYTYTYEYGLLELGGVETPCTLTDTLLTLLCPLTEMAGDLGLPVDMSGIDRMDISLLLDRQP